MTLSAMPLAPNPNQVHALVVGIETYGLGAAYGLDGPAQDGLGFIDWLLTRGVPPGHVHFFASPLGKNAATVQQAKDKGVSVYPATRDAIDGFIRNNLITEHMRGEGLQVFWAGHGVLTKTQAATRRLFFTDTTAENKLNLELDSLVQALATAAYGSGFGRQIFWVDACANSYFQGLYETGQAEGAGQRYSATGEVEKAEQFVLFAAADYGVAKNDVAAGTGVFSRAVLEVLDGQPLWPAMETLAKQVQEVLREKGQPEPVYRWTLVDGSKEEVNNLKRLNRENAKDSLTLDKQGRLQKEIDLLKEKLDRCFEKRLLTDDPDRVVTLEKLEQKLENDIAVKQKELNEL